MPGACRRRLIAGWNRVLGFQCGGRSNQQPKCPNDIFTLAGLDSWEPNIEEDVHGESAELH